MASFAQITGRLGQTPDLNFTNGGTPVVNLSVASNRQKKGPDGERVDVADWFRVSLFGRNAEIIAEYAKKGSALAFNGRLLTDSYVDREGQQRTSTYLIADSFEFVSTGKHAEDSGNVEAKGEANDESQDASQDDAGAGKAKRKARSKAKDDSEIPF